MASRNIGGIRFNVNFLKENDFGMQRFTVKHIVLLIAIGCMLYLLPNNLPLGQLNLASMDNGGLSSLLASFTGSFYSNIIQEDRYLILLDGLKTTAIISVCATLFGTLLGGLVCFMRMSPNRALSAMAKVYISILGRPAIRCLGEGCGDHPGRRLIILRGT